jgi:hypothetical protein
MKVLKIVGTVHTGTYLVCLKVLNQEFSPSVLDQNIRKI